MKLFVHNDGKKSSESFEVWSELIDVRDYGATEEEAMTNHFARLKCLSRNISEMLANPPKMTRVDWAGNSFASEHCP